MYILRTPEPEVWETFAHAKDRNPFLATNFELCPAPAQQDGSDSAYQEQPSVVVTAATTTPNILFWEFPKIGDPDNSRILSIRTPK